MTSFAVGAMNLLRAGGFLARFALDFAGDFVSNALDLVLECRFSFVVGGRGTVFGYTGAGFGLGSGSFRGCGSLPGGFGGDG